MKVGVLGSGFGLYGYLPALILASEKKVFLPYRYSQKLSQRSDISKFLDKILWVDTDHDILSKVEALVISRRPKDQELLVNEALTYTNISHFLLEKPIARNPILALNTMNQLLNQRKKIRVGYTFRYTKWGEEILKRKFDSLIDEPINIEWLFKANHYLTDENNWKRYVSEGGGALRFFGIHLIALLSEIGYTSVLFSKIATERINEAESWTAKFSGVNLPDANIKVDSNSTVHKFSVRTGNFITLQRDPFESDSLIEGVDQRVSGIGKLCIDLLDITSENPEWYIRSLELWLSAEKAL